MTTSRGSATAPPLKQQQGETDFYWSKEPEPHAARRLAILKKYPEIKELMGHDPNLKWVVLLVMTIQTTTAYFAPFMPTWMFLATVLVIGGTCGHMLQLAGHELSHNLGFKSMQLNRAFAIFSNMPMGVPSAITFKRYHMDHHKYQGLDGVDVDIPTEFEAKYLLSSTFGRAIFVVFQLVFYALRPLIVSPKDPTVWEAMNWIACVSFDAVILLAWGKWSLIYLLASSLFGTALHPIAGHFIAEHYMFDDSAETFSYYGWLNIFAFNVGYHNEHHDFPYIPGSRLPKVREIASEFYDKMPRTESWGNTLLEFIFSPRSTGYRRMKRLATNTD